MDHELFSQLLESLKQGRDILQGKIEPARVTLISKSEIVVTDNIETETEFSKGSQRQSKKP